MVKMRIKNNTVVKSAIKVKTSFKDMLEAVDAVNESLKTAKSMREFTESSVAALRYLSTRLALTKRQCILLSVFLDNCFDRDISLGRVADLMHVSVTGMLRLWPDLDKLEERGYIVCSRGGYNGTSYRMPMDILGAFKYDRVYVEPGMGNEKLSLDQLFEQIATLFGRRSDDDLPYAMFLTKIETLLKNNSHLDFVSRLFALHLERESRILLLYFCHLLVTENEVEVGNYDIGKIFEVGKLANIKRQLSLGQHELQREGLIDFSCDYGAVDRTLHCLTDKATKGLLSDVELPSNEYKAGLTSHSEIAAKELFYNEEDERQISDLAGLLSEENYQSIRQRLQEKGMRQGFACLFYGGPGTGKTETVLQLAKQTGRDIMQVDISQVRSKWVGDSEKNVKGVFDQYRKAVGKNKKAPILFFNEADAILNMRQEGAQRAVEKMENSIQNIILEELEKLDGIFIATTNLANNLDPAFERRFLYKVNFHKPTTEARTKIWKSMLPDVAEDRLSALAAEFDFSGGQIENIARHYAIDNILYGANSLDRLRQFCLNERISNYGTRRIGFVV